MKGLGATFGKPVFPVLNTTTALASLFGPDSWYFFNLLNIDAFFLDEEWNTRKTYRTSKSIVQRLYVVNDCAKRKVKSAFDFNNTAKKSFSLSNTLQVVEKNKSKDYGNLQKKKTNQIMKVTFHKSNFILLTAGCIFHKSNFILPTAICIAN